MSDSENWAINLKRPAIEIANNGQDLVSTNYWETDQAKLGFYFLSTNAGCCRLLVPHKQIGDIPEMTRDVAEVILTRGRFKGMEGCVEVMFEDFSMNPFCIQVDAKQLDRHWVPANEGKRWRFTIWTQANGKVADFARCYLRHAPELPYALPWGRR